jgi:CRP/FNR family cyclic AMP-dependent transcriptional regulator
LVADPDLASAIDNSARRQSALREVRTRRSELLSGEQLDRRRISQQAKCGVLVLSGFIVRELSTAPGRVSADLFGPEDLVQPDGTMPEVAMLKHTVSWTAITDVRLGLLDEEFFERTARWPEIGAALLERAGRFGERLALRGAIATLQSVDARLLASLWTWAAQWATVAGQGVVLRVPLSHERLARLVNARRPTVTTAIGRLRRAGLIAQREDGAWLLHGPHATDDELTWDGVGIPALGEMLQGGGSSRARRPSSDADARVLAARDLKARLAEQREMLRVAAERHHAMLERMQEEAGRLKAASRR